MRLLFFFFWQVAIIKGRTHTQSDTRARAALSALDDSDAVTSG